MILMLKKANTNIRSVTKYHEHCRLSEIAHNVYIRCSILQHRAAKSTVLGVLTYKSFMTPALQKKLCLSVWAMYLARRFTAGLFLSQHNSCCSYLEYSTFSLRWAVSADDVVSHGEDPNIYRSRYVTGAQRL